jgi:signal transduction histidine kinase
MIRMNSLSPVAHMMGQDEVQSVVHDLRSPMTIIKGNLQLLLSGVMGQMTSEQLTLIKRSVDPLEDLILLTENLLESATLEQNDLSLRLEETDLDKLLSDTIDFYSGAFNQREMTLFRNGNTYGLKLKLDVSWMKRVLNNLIWNAYKFTPDHGKVAIRVEPSQEGLDLIVEDSGRGIPADKICGLFEKFTQVAPSKDCKIGTGLGLWICKRILELHGGTIRVESVEGKGSRFILHIPSSCIL